MHRTGLSLQDEQLTHSLSLSLGFKCVFEMTSRLFKTNKKVTSLKKTFEVALKNFCTLKFVGKEEEEGKNVDRKFLRGRFMEDDLSQLNSTVFSINNDDFGTTNMCCVKCYI